MGVFGFSLKPALTLLLFNVSILLTAGILYPQSSETRELRTLDGLWNFLSSETTNEGKSQKWFSDDLNKKHQTISMPVPASFNDITTDNMLRDHVGTVWYDRKFYIPKRWKKQKRVWMRFGSVNYRAEVYVNGNLVAEHEFGQLPFEVEITKQVQYGRENRVTVSCSNILNAASVPQGHVEFASMFGKPNFVQNYTFDFFNYAGIQRSVHLFTTPIRYIEDIELSTTLSKDKNLGNIHYKVVPYCADENKYFEHYYDPDLNCKARNSDKDLIARVRLYNREGLYIVQDVAYNPDLQGVVEVKNVKLWWPYLMNPDPGYLYEMEFSLLDNKSNIHDIYRLSVGFRSLSWTDGTFKINDQPVYFQGFGRHEDSDIHGRGFDYTIMTRDFNLIKWIGANAYRTSHYPHSEESLQLADQYGIMIIDESPGVNTDFEVEHELDHYRMALKQLIHRDRNHPCVMMWSIANAPLTDHEEAASQFQSIADYTRSLDPLRPVTAALDVSAESDKASQALDVIGIISFNGWYHNPGRLDLITQSVIGEVKAWYKKYKKPIMMAEYGGSSVDGLHTLPSYVWSEDYQCDLFSQHFQAFDTLRKNDWFIGEFVWNFADFKTTQSSVRIGSNKKGIFTRSRHPKDGAHHLRRRYFALCSKMNKCEKPDDLDLYIKKK